MTDTQVLVAGGGPVGLAAAIEARLAGLDVTVVEPGDGAIDKACGEGLMPGALPELARSYVHLHANRLLGVDSSRERLALGLLRRTTASLAASPLRLA